MTPLHYLAAGLCLWLQLFVGSVNAQNWEIRGATSNQQTQIRAAWKQAIDIAAKASNMLSTRANDGKVKETIQLILGPNGNVDWARFHLASVARYAREPSQVSARNTDVYVYANGDFLRTTTVGTFTGVLNTPQNNWVDSSQVSMYNLCNSRTQIGPDMNTFAVTTSSDIVDTPRYNAAVQAWYQTPSSHTAPILSQFSTPQPKVPNLMNICKLALLHNIFDSTITKDMLSKGAADNLPFTEVHERSPANYLLKQLTGTILHELTHTNLGGRANDFPPGQCYGWDCLSYGKTSGHNADTVALLGIALWMIDEGYYLNTFGLIRAI